MSSSLAFAIAMAALAAPLAVAAPGCNYPTASSAHGTRGGVPADPEKAHELLHKAETARDAGKMVDARQLCMEASRYADEAVQREIDDVLRGIDRAEASSLTKPLVEAAAKGDCQRALELGVKAHERSRGTMLEFVRADSEAELGKCLLAALAKGPDDQLLVRRLLERRDTKRVLGDDGFRKVSEGSSDLLAKDVATRLDKPIAAGDYRAVRAALDELVSKREIGKREVDRVMQGVRPAIAAEVKSQVRSALGKDKITKTKLETETPKDVLQRVDELLDVAGWAEPGAPAGGDATPLPAETADLRRALAIWVTCRELECKTSGGKRVWALGPAEWLTPTDPGADPAGRLKHATPLWQVAEASGWVLVTDRDPGSGGTETGLMTAKGWVKAGEVRAQDTSKLLPPGDGIVGLRVWGPLREGDGTLELGTATAADGDSVTVKRLADRQDVTVPRAKLRFGVVEAGTRVLAQCASSVPRDPATVESVLETSDDPIVTVSCLDPGGKPTGTTRRGPLGSLRTTEARLDGR